MCNAWNHPPGCTCGFGGEGHLGGSGWSSEAWQSYTPVGTTQPLAWRDADFTRPTTCPECGAEVYFIRHNGGSVWVDELGWPWPKHACFDTHEPTHSFSIWSAKASGLNNPKLGVVTEMSYSAFHAQPVLKIRLDDSKRFSLVLRWIPQASDVIGALVVISLDDQLLLHPNLGEIAFHSATEIADPNPWYKCKRCDTWVRENTGHETHCKKHYHPKKKRKPPATTPALRPPRRPKNMHLDERIAAAIDEIAQKAWEFAATLADPSLRLKAAKQEALRLIRMLSPHIKGQVEHYFTAGHWAALRARMRE